MNELFASLDEIAANVVVSDDPETRLDQYKNRGKSLVSHDERRSSFLKNLKTKRQNYVNLARCLAEGDIAKSANLSDNEDETEMDYEVKPNRYRKKMPVTKERYRNQIMCSEWMLEVPSKFENDWLMKICPIGKRSLIVASNGETKVYSRKNGQRINSFCSLLPGGSRKFLHKTGNFTILDCVYCIKQKIFYILDVMCWNGYPVYDCVSEFRFFWLKDKLMEVPGLDVKSALNWFPFVELPTYNCNDGTITSVLNEPFPYQGGVDGLLFFHKQGHYTPGISPLVIWLKTYMVPEVFGIEVPKPLDNKPVAYHTFKIFAAEQMAIIERKERLNCIMNVD